MSFENRINRMETAGSITSAQAEEMRASIQAMGKVLVEPQKRKLPLGMIAGVGCVVLVTILLIAGGGSTEPEVIQNVSEIINEVGKVGTMSKGMTTSMSLFVILLPIILSGIGFVWLYNDLINKEEEVLASWSQVESNYQRRADLVPNLVNTVKTFMEHEKGVLTEVTEERSAPKLAQVIEELSEAQKKAGELSVDSQKKLDDESYMDALAVAQRSVGDQVTRLFGLVENYPQLRSADNFLALQDQLEGTENRVNVSRMAFNDSVRDYNSAIRKLPGTLIAGMGDFQRKAYFEADEAAGKAVKVDF